MMKHILICSALIIVFGLSTTGMSSAGVILKETMTTEMVSPMGNQTTTDNTTIYMDKGKIKSVSETDNAASIVRLDKEAMYQVDIGKKTYQEIPFKALQSMSEKMMSGENPQMKEAMKNMTPEQQQMMKNMMSKMFAAMTVSKTSESKSMLGHKCIKYEVSREGTKMMDLWATEDFDVGTDFSEFLKIKMPGNKEMFAEFSKIKGMPLETIITMDMGGMRTKVHSLATDIKNASISASEFEVPLGYTKETADLENLYK